MSDLLRIELIVLALLIGFFIFRKIRKGKIETQDTLFWLLVILALFVGALFPNVVVAVTEFMGLETPSNLVFLIAIVALLLLNLKHTESISQANRKIRNLIQEISILKNKINQIENNNDE